MLAVDPSMQEAPTSEPAQKFDMNSRAVSLCGAAHHAKVAEDNSLAKESSGVGGLDRLLGLSFLAFNLSKKSG